VLGAIYREHACLWRRDPEPAGFAWIDQGDRDASVYVFERRDGDDHLVVVMNLTPLAREGYRIGAPARATYRTLLSTDDGAFGGGGHARPDRVVAEPEPCHGHDQSLVLTLPPLAILVLEPESGEDGDASDAS